MNKILLQAGATTDPPPQHGHLQGTSQGPSANVNCKPFLLNIVFMNDVNASLKLARKSDADSSTGEMPERFDDHSETEEVNKEFEWMSSPSKETDPANSKLFTTDAIDGILTFGCVVIVNFYDHQNSRAPPREVWVKESTTVTVEFKGADDGTGIWTMHLSCLLPEVIKTDSPIKGLLITYSGRTRYTMLYCKSVSQ